MIVSNKLDFEQINNTCSKGDLIRTKPPLAEMVCDRDKKISEYPEEGEEWVTCVYHGKARVLDEDLVSDTAGTGGKEAKQ